jgi:hypothetical protein
LRLSRKPAKRLLPLRGAVFRCLVPTGRRRLPDVEFDGSDRDFCRPKIAE